MWMGGLNRSAAPSRSMCVSHQANAPFPRTCTYVGVGCHRPCLGVGVVGQGLLGQRHLVQQGGIATTRVIHLYIQHRRSSTGVTWVAHWSDWALHL
jgi:hypothetical protein